MRWPYVEYVLKGLFLSLVVYAALQIGIEPANGDSVTPLLRFNLPILIGLVLSLTIAAVSKLHEGYQIKGRALFFFILLLLESHSLVYLGVIGGAVVGAFLLLQWPPTDLLWQVLGGGAVLGVIFVLQRLIRARLIRLSVILVVASALATGLFLLLVYAPDSGFHGELQNPQLFAIQLLLGIPFFYALTFAGREEESEVEIGAMCATLGVSVSLLTYQQPGFKSMGVILPVFLYLGYTMRILPALRVFKHVLRGLSHVRIGRHRQALQAFRRALQLDPNNKLAREGFWDLHRTLDLEQLGRDPQLQALVDFDLCLERAGSLLLDGKPTEAQMKEAQALLGLVLNQRPEKQPAVAYWQAVAFTHLGQYEEAAAELARVLDPGVFGRHNAERSRILLSAWQLALLLH
jgi:hypothetical protein